MKYRHLFWGILLIAIGLLFVLNNLGIIYFSWHSIWRLWPLILIIWGISILPVRDTIKFTALIVTIIASFFVINSLPQGRSGFFGFHHHHGDNSFGWDSEDEDEDETTTYNYRDQNFTVPFDSLAKKGILNLDAAAGNFRIEGSTSEFLEFGKQGEIGNYELTTKDFTGGKDISLRLQEGGRVHGSFKKNKVGIKLNTEPAWNLRLDIGAAELHLDLTEYKIDTATVEAGASSMDIKIGEKNPLTVLTFDAGASSIDVDVPKNSGCQITSESFLVSKDFHGFTKKADHTYQTENFNTAKNKVFITIKTAVSSIDVNRY
jgi:hypothetical protein